MRQIYITDLFLISPPSLVPTPVAGPPDPKQLPSLSTPLLVLLPHRSFHHPRLPFLPSRLSVTSFSPCRRSLVAIDVATPAQTHSTQFHVAPLPLTALHRSSHRPPR